MNAINPEVIAEKRITLSEEYSRLSDELASLEMLYSKFFIQERENYKSDKAVEMAYNGTESGLRAIGLRRREKAITKEMSALNSYLQVKNNQARNHY